MFYHLQQDIICWYLLVYFSVYDFVVIVGVKKND